LEKNLGPEYLAWSSLYPSMDLTAIDPNGIGIFTFDIGGRPSNDSSDYLALAAGDYVVINFTQPIVYFGHARCRANA
jgi:hypothetical protein